MNIQTEENFCGLDKKSPLSKNFNILKYEDGSMSTIPHGFFRDWLDNDLLDTGIGDFYIGRCSGVGVGSVAKYDTNQQSLKIGRYVAGGLRLKFILNGQHDMECISTSMLSFFADGLRNTAVPQYQDTVIKNDVWIGDEAMFLGGGVVENGCVIGARSLVPPNFKSEPYGVYVGSPARLVKFRFSEKIRELLLQLEWWNMPLNWLRVENDKFLLNLARMAEGAAIDVLQGLIESKKQMLKRAEGKMKINNKAVNVAQTLESLPEDGMECAIYLQQQWRFEDARKKYEELLRGNPEDASALHNIGVLFSVQLLEPSTALPYFEAALNINPTRLQFWFSYIDALIKADALEVAEHVLSLASGYGLNDLQIASFERDIRLARTTVNDLVAVALKKAAPLPEPQPVQAVASVGDEPSIADLQQLLSLFNQKKYERAVKNATTLLVRFPTSASVWRLLAESEKRAGHWQKALEAYRQAASLLPADASAQMLWADALLGAGQQHEAAAVLQRILRMQPDYAAAHAKMGQVFQAQGALEEAVQSYARALQQEPNNPIFLEKFGATLRLQGDQDGALVCFKAAVDASPNSAELLDAYGVTLRNQERLGAAENAFRQALKIHPGYTQALRNLCHLLEVHGRFAEAEAGLLRCAEIDNESPESLYEIGRNLVQQKKENEALEWLRRAIKAQPDYAAAHITLSAALNATEDPLAAMEEIKASIKVLPNIPHLHTNLGIVNLSLSRADDAIACFRKALEIAPNFSHARSSMLFALSHSTKITPEELYREHRAYGKLIEEEVKGKEYTTYTNSRTTDRPLKIGFVSADLRNHAVAKFVIPFFEELHKRPEFITYAYSNHGAVDESMLAIQKNMDVWRTVVQWSDDKLAEKIREDQIDILVDMSGHTAGDRLKIFARHPAPVQMTWLGYPGTTGLKAMDYLVTEESLLPGENISPQFTEKIIRLPRAFSFDGKSTIQPVGAAPCIENGFITFGSFNRLNKINREVIALWSAVLRAVPDSRLQMAAMPANGAPEELLAWFQEESISEDRLYFYPRSGFSEYLKLHNQVDLCLDTFPYTGGTTTLHALWMGVPTLTLAGKTYPSYQGALVAHQVGLEKYLVARDFEDFIQKAIFMAKNKIFLNMIRKNLGKYLIKSNNEKISQIVDGFTKSFLTVWSMWCSGSKPGNIKIDDESIGFNKDFPDWEEFFKFI